MKSCYVKFLTFSGSEVNFIGHLQVNVTYGGQSYSNFVNIDKMGQPVLLGRNWHKKIVLYWKTVISGVRPNAYKSQSEEQNLNRPTLKAIMLNLNIT